MTACPEGGRLVGVRCVGSGALSKRRVPWVEIGECGGLAVHTVGNLRVLCMVNTWC